LLGNSIRLGAKPGWARAVRNGVHGGGRGEKARKEGQKESKPGV